MSPSHGRVCTLGMFIIDKFVSAATLEHEEQIGGGGVYAMIGARTFLPASSVGMIVDRGADFPPEMQTRLEEYGSDMFFFRDRTDGGCITTRALNLYSGQRPGDGPQDWRYITPKLLLFPRDIATSPFFRPTPPAYLHIVCNPSRFSLILSQLDAIASDGVGEDGFGKGWNPQLVWEPFPPSCVSEELENILSAARDPRVKILSPNHIEALSLLGITPGKHDTLGPQIYKATWDLARNLLPGSAVIVRSGAMGACVCVQDEHGKMNLRSIPPYYNEGQQDKVMDVTGGGNAFLGGVCAGLVLSRGNVFEACLYGMVSASFAIEQSGPPRLTGVDGLREMWNGTNPTERLQDITRWTEEEIEQ